MQWPARFGVTKDETTRAIFVVRVVFNDLALTAYSIFHLRHTYVSDAALVNSLFGGLILSPLKFRANSLDRRHSKKLSTPRVLVNLLAIQRWVHPLVGPPRKSLATA